LQLPIRSDVGLRLIAMLEDPDVDVRQVASVVSSDPGLAARLLRLANSPYFGLGRRVGSVERAVVLLGFSVVRALAVSVAAGLLATGRSVGSNPYFWEHSASVAAGTSIVARYAGSSPGDAFTAGLLHDLGSVLSGEPPPTAGGASPQHPIAPETSAASELSMFGLAHAEHGARLLEEWRPRDHHQRRALPPRDPRHRSTLVGLVDGGRGTGSALRSSTGASARPSPTPRRCRRRGGDRGHRGVINRRSRASDSVASIRST
jgi:HD-like signal output (HDOD) protein